MTESPSQLNLKLRLDDITASYPREVAITRIMGLLRDEYARLDEAMKGIRQRYLALSIDNPADEHELADLRLEAVGAYQPAYTIESYLTAMDADITLMIPQYSGEFQTSAVHKKGWDLSFVSLKEGAMRSLGGHCDVIGTLVMLERKLYHQTYLAAVMQPAGSDRGVIPAETASGEAAVEFSFSTVVFDEDVNALVEK